MCYFRFRLHLAHIVELPVTLLAWLLCCCVAGGYEKLFNFALPFFFSRDMHFLSMFSSSFALLTKHPGTLSPSALQLELVYMFFMGMMRDSPFNRIAHESVITTIVNVGHAVRGNAAFIKRRGVHQVILTLNVLDCCTEYALCIELSVVLISAVQQDVYVVDNTYDTGNRYWCILDTIPYVISIGHGPKACAFKDWCNRKRNI
jgi:hypothetical protein